MDAETFQCPNCSTEIFVEDVRGTEGAVCPQCGNSYQIEYDDLMETYHLQPQEPPQFPMDIDTDRV